MPVIKAVNKDKKAKEMALMVHQFFLSPQVKQSVILVINWYIRVASGVACDKPIFKNFCRRQDFTDFDIKIVLLGQNFHLLLIVSVYN